MAKRSQRSSAAKVTDEDGLVHEVVEEPDVLDAEEQDAELRAETADDADAKAAANRKAAREEADSVDSEGVSDGDSKADDEAPKRRRRSKKAKPVRVGNPQWFVPLMITLFIVGLVWIVVFYLSQTEYPIPGRGYWNLVIGFGILMAGFGMSTRWK